MVFWDLTADVLHESPNHWCRDAQLVPWSFDAYSSVSARARSSTLANALRRTKSSMSAHFKGLAVVSSSGVDGDASSLSPQARLELVWGRMARMRSIFSPLRGCMLWGAPPGVLGVTCLELICVCGHGYASYYASSFADVCQLHASAEFRDSSPTSFLTRLHCFLSPVALWASL